MGEVTPHVRLLVVPSFGSVNHDDVRCKLMDPRIGREQKITCLGERWLMQLGVWRAGQVYDMIWYWHGTGKAVLSCHLPSVSKFSRPVLFGWLKARSRLYSIENQHPILWKRGMECTLQLQLQLSRDKTTRRVYYYDMEGGIIDHFQKSGLFAE